MQSESPANPPRWERPWPKWSNGILPLLVFGVLPFCGLAAELLTGMLSSALSLFPTAWHAVAVALAVVANLLLHIGLYRERRWLVPRALSVGFVLGMALLYALVELPATPYMAFMVIVGLGFLAAAPYFALFGTPRLYGDLSTCWRVAGRAPWQCRVLVLFGALLPLGLVGWDACGKRGDATAMIELAPLLRARDGAVPADRLAQRLRDGDVALQRAMCRNGVRRGNDLLDDAFFFAANRFDRGPFAHIGTGYPFWFVLDSSIEINAEAARAAFHRAHGFGWDDPVWNQRAPDPDARRGGIDWLASRFTVTHEPAAALVRIDHELELSSAAQRPREAHFELRLPAGAVASSLSAWIDGHERPAAFGGAAQVQKAYDAVVQRNRDPVLLQEVAPQRLRLLMFPLGRDWPPMRVRIGYTVPLCVRGEAAFAWLPTVISHNCRADLASHELVVDGAPLRRLDAAELQQALRFPRRDVVAVAKDADGHVVQRLVPRAGRPPSDTTIVVLEASASVARAVADPVTLLDALPAGAQCALFVAHGCEFVRCDAAIGSQPLRQCIALQPFTGGCDPWAALEAAMRTAQERGIRQILWLHGASAARPSQGLGRPELPADVEIAAFALHPGSHALREDPVLRRRIVDLPRAGATSADLLASLQEGVRFGASPRCDLGDLERRFERVATPPAEAVVVSDQLARLWAAREARSAAYADLPGPARSLASRYRLVTGGVGAVVLERAEQYAAAGLDPGAEIGREPAGPIGSGPVPEPSTFVLLASGLAAVWWLRRKRAA